MVEIAQLTADEGREALPALTRLLVETAAGGASIGAYAERSNLALSHSPAPSYVDTWRGGRGVRSPGISPARALFHDVNHHERRTRTQYGRNRGRDHS